MMFNDADKLSFKEIGKSNIDLGFRCENVPIIISFWLRARQFS